LRPEGSELFSLAGIWESGGTSPGAMDTFVILTTQASPEIADIHHRQPLMLEEEALEEWLRPGPAPVGLVTRAKNGSGPAYERRPVSGLVNSPRNDSPALLVPAMMAGPTGGEERSQLALL